INVLSGRIPKFAGKIIFENRVLNRLTTKRAMKRGINAIHSQLYLYPKWSAFENIYLNYRIKKNFLLPDQERMRQRALDIFSELSIPDIGLDVPVKYFPLTKQQMVQIVKSICFPSKLLLIDEMSVKLTPEQLDRFHYLLSVLCQKGTTIIYATSNMEEIFNFASRVSILKNGRVIETTNISDIDKLHLVKLTYSFMTRRKELEESNFELFYLKHFYENIFNHIPLPLMVTDTKGNIVFLNTSITEYFDIEASDYTDRYFNDLINLPSESVKKIDETIFNMRELRFSLPLDFSLSFRKLYMIPLYDEDGSFMGTLSTIDEDGGLNIAGEKNPKPGSMFSPEKFAGRVAHEINNPLSIILNYLKVIKTEESPSLIKLNLDNVEKEVNRIKHIIEKSMHVEELGTQSFTKTRVDTLLNEVISLMRPTMEHNNIRLNLRIRPGILASVDPDLIKQVIVNIVLNAVEAMPQGGVVSISADFEKAGQDIYIVISIEDNGVGMEEKKLENIFNPFYTTKDHGEMGGLGLSICKDILSQYNGCITVKSIPNQGITFKIFLPYQ
ncbi:MAG: ATP-binding protein, partial [Spirochaetota bacterium]